MAGISDINEGGQNTSVYYSASKIATKDYTTINAAAIAGNEVVNVTDIPELEDEANLFDLPIYNEPVARKIPGQSTASEAAFEVAFDNSNAIHQALRDADKTVIRTFIIKMEDGAGGVSFYVFDGRVAGTSFATKLNEARKLTFTVARDGGLTWIDAP